MIPDLSKEIVTIHGGLPRILIIDDDAGICKVLERMIKLTKCETQIANSYDEAVSAIVKAEEENAPFSVATIDMRFKVGEGEEKIELPRGTELLQHIKANYPHLPCLLISAMPITPPEILLDLRDEYELDYFISKNRLEPLRLARAIRKTANRAKLFANTAGRAQKLKQILEQYQDVVIAYSGNLATAERRKALKGIDVDVETENEIRQYQQKLQEAKEEIRKLEEALRGLQGR